MLSIFKFVLRYGRGEGGNTLWVTASCTALPFVLLISSTRQNSVELTSKRPAEQDIEDEINDAIQLLTNQAYFIDVLHPVATCRANVGSHEEIAMFCQAKRRYQDAEGYGDAQEHNRYVERLIGIFLVALAHLTTNAPLAKQLSDCRGRQYQKRQRRNQCTDRHA